MLFPCVQWSRTDVPGRFIGWGGPPRDRVVVGGRCRGRDEDYPPPPHGSRRALLTHRACRRGLLRGLDNVRGEWNLVTMARTSSGCSRSTPAEPEARSRRQISKATRDNQGPYQRNCSSISGNIGYLSKKRNPSPTGCQTLSHILRGSASKPARTISIIRSLVYATLSKRISHLPCLNPCSI